MTTTFSRLSIVGLPFLGRRLARAAVMGLLPVFFVVTTGDARRAATPITAAGVIARHTEAIGGRRSINAIRSVTSAGIMNDHGTLHPMYTDRRRPNLLRVRMFHGGDLVFTEVYDGTKSWEGAPGKEECAPPAAATRATAHAALQFDDALLAAEEAHATIVYAGREELGGRPLHHLEVVGRDGVKTAVYVDAETYLLDRTRTRRALHPGQPERAIETVYDDYRFGRGARVLVPFRELERDVDTGEFLTLSRADWIEFNAPLADNAFARPEQCG